MFSSIANVFRSKNRSIFLGEVFVNERNKLVRLLEFDLNDENKPEQLEEWVKNLLEIPMLSQSEHVESGALILDVAVRKYRLGTDFALYCDPVIPILWRPSISIDMRIREYDSNNTLGEYSISRVLGWREYFRRAFSFSSMFRFGSLFNSNDLKHLLAMSLLDGLVLAKRQEKS